MKLPTRDFDFIDSRLCAPCTPALEAHERLRRYTDTFELAEQANRLMYGMQQFTDLCRDIRQQLNHLSTEH